MNNHYIKNQVFQNVITYSSKEKNQYSKLYMQHELNFFFFQGELKEGIGSTCEKGNEMMGAFICILIGFQIFQIWYNAYL